MPCLHRHRAERQIALAEMREDVGLDGVETRRATSAALGDIVGLARAECHRQQIVDMHDAELGELGRDQRLEVEQACDIVTSSRSAMLAAGMSRATAPPRSGINGAIATAGTRSTVKRDAAASVIDAGFRCCSAGRRRPAELEVSPAPGDRPSTGRRRMNERSSSLVCSRRMVEMHGAAGGDQHAEVRQLANGRRGMERLAPERSDIEARPPCG